MPVSSLNLEFGSAVCRMPYIMKLARSALPCMERFCIPYCQVKTIVMVSAIGAHADRSPLPAPCRIRESTLVRTLFRSAFIEIILRFLSFSVKSFAWTQKKSLKTSRYLHSARQIAGATPNYPSLFTTTPFPSPRFLLWKTGGGEAARAASTRGVRPRG